MVNVSLAGVPEEGAGGGVGDGRWRGQPHSPTTSHQDVDATT